MSHEVETMAWTNEKPWHGLGFEVSNKLTALQMMKASKTDWTVSKAPLFAKIQDQNIMLPEMALVRDSDQSILDIVGEDWTPTQNETAFDFFREFVEQGKMTMETAGSLKKGKMVWVLAKVGNNFELFDGDKVESYLLFSNPHQYGMSIDVRFTSVRVVCNNTITMALNAKANKVFKASHRAALDLSVVKETLGIVEKKMVEYKANATFLGSTEYTDESVLEYFNEIFPRPPSVKEDKAEKISKNAKNAVLALTHQPGVEFAKNSWWQAYNAISYVTDHMMGREDDTRVYNMWYGQTKDLKLKAFAKAMDYASKA